jgi:ubiquinone/menaquinone biosynthesis C-methylase UbiE
LEWSREDVLEEDGQAHMNGEERSTESPFFGIYNWSLYLAQAILLLLLLGFCFLFALTLRALPFFLVTILLLGVAILHGLLLWREDRLALSNFSRNVVRQISKLMDSVREGPVLDAGCGLGRTLIGLLRERLSLSVTAVDIWDQEQILGNSRNQLLRNLKAAGVADRAVVERADVRKLPFEDGTFSCALATWVVHELSQTDQLVALSELARVVGPSGHVIVVEYLQCARNFFVFGIINWHYYSMAHWLDICTKLDLVIERREERQGIVYLLLRIASR